MIASRIIFLALLSGFVNALPHSVRDSSINEPAVSAPDGTPITEGAQPAETPVDNNSSGSWSESSMGYGESASESSGSYGGSSGSYGGSSGSYGGSSSGDMESMSSMDESWGASSMDWSASMDSTSTADSMPTSTSTTWSSYQTPSYDSGNSKWDSSTSAADSMSTSTSTAWSSYQTPSYGSGSSNWGSSNSGYDNCVSQCMAQYGSPPQASASPTQTTPDGVSTGNGAKHTVIVGTAEGVYQYMPFMLNASVGDTVEFVWKFDKHTVTKSSQLLPCNKTSDAPFTSGTQGPGATFTQMINDTNPLFYYCGVPGHCQQGMFGVINPSSAADAPTSVSMMMSNWTTSDSDLSAYAAYVNDVTQNNIGASNWGGNMDVKDVPGWAHASVAKNVMYNRAFAALNPDIMNEDGTMDLSKAGNTPLMFPKGMNEVLSNAGAGAAVSTPSSSAETSVAAAGAPEATSAPSSETPSANTSISNGATTTSPKFVIALAAAAASFLLL
ncbi:hypothetical protein AGABI2DRAFT_190521 [Agaricus bisporus var. bisporus H97]|uniref:hypothetical protein n=1 Tax=Agaricus bisporus var. bisporus (strain H97 / ATCC MYA-4626 / FGSC 10389) TaxID=936046 RepID=UPI00029F7767|nr:hypothetical protein AGABI2DRAFT_190521 [Agaricus bisporus var. bisporus H97]EKV50118.1 hypothetical protein AGABI2DRAFT_190521 [Agaricus bisporus var. bisporus H97]